MMSRSRCAPLLVLSVLGAVGLLVAGPATAAKVVKVKSTVTISSGEGTEFKGKVSSGNKKCRSGRKVQLFKDLGSRDQLVGSAKTDASGMWEIHGSFLAAMYHAEVAGRIIHTGSGTLNCLPDVGLTARF
jgi:hypothetical protein